MARRPMRKHERINICLVAGRDRPNPGKPGEPAYDVRGLTEQIRRVAQHEVAKAEAVLDFDFGETLTTLEGLHRALRERPQTILHVVSHGDTSGDLLIDDMWGEGDPFMLSPESFAGVLRNRGVKVVIVSGCHGGIAAQTLVEKNAVNIAIGIDGAHTLSFDAALSIAQGFYGALARGETVAQAFEASQSAIQERAPDEAERMQLCQAGRAAEDPEVLHPPAFFVISRTTPRHVAAVNDLREALERKGEALFHQADVPIGAPILEMIGNRLGMAKIIMTIFDGTRFDDEDSLLAIAHAVQRARKTRTLLFPLYIEGNELSVDVPYGLGRVQPAFLEDYGGDYDALAEKLVTLIG